MKTTMSPYNRVRPFPFPFIFSLIIISLTQSLKTRAQDIKNNLPAMESDTRV
jgi:hypothetical protein